MSTELDPTLSSDTATAPRLVAWNGETQSTKATFWLPDSGRLPRSWTAGDNVVGTWERKAELALKALGAFKAHHGLGEGSYIMKPVTLDRGGPYRPRDLHSWHSGPQMIRELSDRYQDEQAELDVELMRRALGILGITRP